MDWVVRTHYEEDEERLIVAVLSFRHRLVVRMCVSEPVSMAPLVHFVLLGGRPNEQVE